jgi:hypothetical protein
MPADCQFDERGLGREQNGANLIISALVAPAAYFADLFAKREGELGL